MGQLLSLIKAYPLFTEQYFYLIGVQTEDQAMQTDIYLTQWNSTVVFPDEEGSAGS